MPTNWYADKAGAGAPITSTPCRGQRIIEHADTCAQREVSRHAQRADHDEQPKACSALCGCTVIGIADGAFLAARADVNAVPCLRAVGDLLRRIGGR